MYHYDEENQLRLIVEYPRFEDLLYSTFYQLRHYGKEDVSVTTSILDALIFIAEGADQSIKNKVWHFSDYIISGFNSSMLQELDKTFLNKKLDQLAQAAHTEQQPNYF
ncbi:hypothetical protein DS031_13095 [Bacillus taeanensis]|uniref:Uncharacterized protein n=1 Tax=Bacillus taeanensis TaxID=273032 RepID=A0A366XWD9_9BACI|nr:hypothetical protein DS031_13095 [Bacillus taeanensis]